MRVRKFHSIEEMKRPNWREPGDPSLYRSLRFILDVGRRTRPRRFPAGVHKHRSIEALNAQTDRWSAAPATEVQRHSHRTSAGGQ